MGDAGKPLCYPECAIDSTWIVREGDAVYCTPPAKGNPMEIAIVEGLYVAEEGEEEVKMLYLRWLYHHTELKKAAQKSMHPRELLLSKTYNPWPMEGLEG